MIQEAIDQLQAKDQDKAFSACLRSYMHMKAFQEALLKDLVIRRTQEDAQVITDWERRVTTLVEIEAPFVLNETVAKRYEELLAQMKSKQINQLVFDKRKARLLLHPSLEDHELVLDNPAVKCFIDRLKKAEGKELDDLIAESPYLSFMTNSEMMKNLIDGKKQAIGFVENIAVAKAIKVVLRKKGIVTKFYRSTGLKDEQKKKRLEWFKNGEDGPKFLLLTYGSARRMGFSLPEADQVWLIDDHYNPGKIKQAIYRAKGVGHAKTVEVIKPKHQIFSSHHVGAILDNKENFFDFLFSKFDSCQDHFVPGWNSCRPQLPQNLECPKKSRCCLKGSR